MNCSTWTFPCTSTAFRPEILNPMNTWDDKEMYLASAKRLAEMFVTNFKQFKDASPKIANAGPNLSSS